MRSRLMMVFVCAVVSANALSANVQTADASLQVSEAAAAAAAARSGGIRWNGQPGPGPVPNTMTIMGSSPDGRIQCVFVISRSWRTGSGPAGTVVDTPHSLSCVRT